LQDKNRGMIEDVADEIVTVCERAAADNEDKKRKRMEDGEVLTNAEKSKAVLVAFRNVNNINAETVISRARDLKILFEHLNPLTRDELYAWSLPVDNVRPTLNWSGRWTHTEDSMLLVGAFMYGFGNWETIAKDPRLGLGGKFFLDEGKKGEESATRPIPNAIHLVRRGDYLLGLLREHDEKLKSYESTLKSKGQLKSATPPAASGGVSASAPREHSSVRHRAESEAVASVEGGASKKRKRRPTPTFTDSSDDDECVPYFPLVPSFEAVLTTSRSESLSEGAEAATKEELRPVKKYLKQLRLTGDDMPREEKVLILKESLAKIGEQIRTVLDRKEAQGDSRDKWRRRLWTCVLSTSFPSCLSNCMLFLGGVSFFLIPVTSCQCSTYRHISRQLDQPACSSFSSCCSSPWMTF
jgi:chromodomain-helicase-DNA-binding protein 1